ncbi:GerAB/ArcD/ProY family transporter [Paenibacillus nanensis]|nr:endospore germination permease [Paenibacillus nanensis]
MSTPSQQLSHKQYIFYMYKTQIGIGVLILPNVLTKAAGNSGWISLLLGWMIATASGYFMIQVMKRHPGQTFDGMLQAVLGKWAGRTVLALWVAYTACTVAVVLYTEVNIIQIWILRDMNQLLLVLALLIPVYRLARCRLQVQGRYAEFVYIFTFWMPPLVLFSLKEAHALNLLPIAGDGLWPILNGIRASLVPFLGFETAFLLYPHLQDKTKAFKGVLAANSLSLLIYIFVFLTSTMYFSSEELRTYLWPTLQLLKAVTMPFIERFEIVFLAYYIILVTQTLSAYLFFAASGIQSLIGSKDHKRPVVLLIVLLIGVAWIWKPTLEEMEMVSGGFDTVSIGMGYVFPLLLWCCWEARRMAKGALR